MAHPEVSDDLAQAVGMYVMNVVLQKHLVCSGDFLLWDSHRCIEWRAGPNGPKT